MIKIHVLITLLIVHVFGIDLDDTRCDDDMLFIEETGSCIDRFEFPNKYGENPLVGISGLPITNDVTSLTLNARDLCGSIEKRVCTREEWTAACKGQDGARYPWGDAPLKTRSDNSDAKCNFAKKYIAPNELLIAKRDSSEFLRLWQAEKSGSRDTCVSASGAYDMVGNVEEWVTCNGPTGWCLMGRFWSHNPPFTCSMAVTHHSPRWQFYETGTRCCSTLE